MTCTLTSWSQPSDYIFYIFLSVAQTQWQVDASGAIITSDSERLKEPNPVNGASFLGKMFLLLHDWSSTLLAELIHVDPNSPPGIS